MLCIENGFNAFRIIRFSLRTIIGNSDALVQQVRACCDRWRLKNFDIVVCTAGYLPVAAAIYHRVLCAMLTLSIYLFLGLCGMCFAERSNDHHSCVDAFSIHVYINHRIVRAYIYVVFGVCVEQVYTQRVAVYSMYVYERFLGIV